MLLLNSNWIYVTRYFMFFIFILFIYFIFLSGKLEKINLLIELQCMGMKSRQVKWKKKKMYENKFVILRKRWNVYVEKNIGINNRKSPCPLRAIKLKAIFLYLGQEERERELWEGKRGENEEENNRRRGISQIHPYFFIIYVRGTLRRAQFYSSHSSLIILVPSFFFFHF